MSTQAVHVFQFLETKPKRKGPQRKEQLKVAAMKTQNSVFGHVQTVIDYKGFSFKYQKSGLHSQLCLFVQIPLGPTNLSFCSQQLQFFNSKGHTFVKPPQLQLKVNTSM